MKIIPHLPLYIYLVLAYLHFAYIIYKTRKHVKVIEGWNHIKGLLTNKTHRVIVIGLIVIVFYPIVFPIFVLSRRSKDKTPDA